MITKDKATELELVRSQHGGVLRPEDVVEFATDADTALHGEFEWDDSVAAYSHRLWQARQVIRLTVTVLDSSAGKQCVPMYVSLMSDRQKDGGGYRAMVDVLTEGEQREELLRQALAELKAVKRRYEQLKELRSVFACVDRLDKSLAVRA